MLFTPTRVPKEGRVPPPFTSRYKSPSRARRHLRHRLVIIVLGACAMAWFFFRSTTSRRDLTRYVDHEATARTPIPHGSTQASIAAQEVKSTGTASTARTGDYGTRQRPMIKPAPPQYAATKAES